MLLLGERLQKRKRKLFLSVTLKIQRCRDKNREDSSPVSAGSPPKLPGGHREAEAIDLSPRLPFAPLSR